MLMNKKRKNKLHGIYKSVPEIKCRGLCTNFCGAIGMEVGEAEEVTKEAGKPPSITDDLTCGYLAAGKCTVYQNRPTICRVFGVTDKLLCPHGCEPERILSFAETKNIIAAVRKIAGEEGKIVLNCTIEQFKTDKRNREEENQSIIN